LNSSAVTSWSAESPRVLFVIAARTDPGVCIVPGFPSLMQTVAGFTWGVIFTSPVPPLVFASDEEEPLPHQERNPCPQFSWIRAVCRARLVLRYNSSSASILAP